MSVYSGRVRDVIYVFWLLRKDTEQKKIATQKPTTKKNIVSYFTFNNFTDRFSLWAPSVMTKRPKISLRLIHKMLEYRLEAYQHTHRQLPITAPSYAFVVVRRDVTVMPSMAHECHQLLVDCFEYTDEASKPIYLYTKKKTN